MWERAIFGVFNSFTVKKVNFFTINVKFKVILSSKSGGGGGGGYLYRPSPTPKKWGGGGGIHPPIPPGFTPVAKPKHKIGQVLVNCFQISLLT